MKVVLIDYPAGNIRSVDFALQRLGVQVEITAEPESILSADRVIFPGVGESGSTMTYLKGSGLSKVIPQIEAPFLGICLGLQLMCRGIEEGNTEGLGIFSVDVKRFDSTERKVPHMGWNKISLPNAESSSGNLKSSKLFSGIADEEYFYFVHSYYAELGPQTALSCNYGNSFSAALQEKNFSAVQFHPEKSAEAGSCLLDNFISE